MGVVPARSSRWQYVTAVDSLTYLGVNAVVEWLLKRFAIIATFGMLASSTSSAEIIDYHQNLYSPEAGVRSSRTRGHRWQGS